METNYVLLLIHLQKGLQHLQQCFKESSTDNQIKGLYMQHLNLLFYFIQLIHFQYFEAVVPTIFLKL